MDNFIEYSVYAMKSSKRGERKHYVDICDNRLFDRSYTKGHFASFANKRY